MGSTFGGVKMLSRRTDARNVRQGDAPPAGGCSVRGAQQSAQHILRVGLPMVPHRHVGEQVAARHPAAQLPGAEGAL